MKGTERRPRVYISYSWRTQQNRERVFDLAESLRRQGVDSRIDLYYADSYHGFLPPTGRLGDDRKPWTIWQEEQIREADRVLAVCTAEYYDSVVFPGDRHSGAWCDIHFMAENLSSGLVDSQKFIPVGFESFGIATNYIPPLLKGATYYDLSPNAAIGLDGLLRRFRTEFPRPRSGVFVSYSHDDKKWLDALLAHLSFLRSPSAEIWTDQEIEPGAKWRDQIDDRLARAQVAVLLVSPSFFASQYIASNELPAMFSAAESEGLIIFWIPIKASGYSHTEIANFQAAHPPSQPLAGLRPDRRDVAYVTIADKLAKALGIVS